VNYKTQLLEERDPTIDVIDKRRLAHGLLVLSGGVANVVAYLRATDGGGVVVDLVRLDIQMNAR
jgi:hypothetical protein